MPLRRSFEKSEGRFVGACTVEGGKPSGMLLGGRDCGDDGVNVDISVIGRGESGGTSGGDSFVRDKHL